MTWKILVIIGIVLLGYVTCSYTAKAQAAPAVAPTEQRPPAVEPQLPSRANNWNLPTIVHYNGERVTEGFWVINLCGKPVMVVYDTEDQMALPIMGPPLLKLGAQRAWELEDSPPLLIVPDLAQTYAALADVCEFLVARDKQHQRENEIVTPPPMRME